MTTARTSIAARLDAPLLAVLVGAPAVGVLAAVFPSTALVVAGVLCAVAVLASSRNGDLLFGLALLALVPVVGNFGVGINSVAASDAPFYLRVLDDAALALGFVGLVVAARDLPRAAARPAVLATGLFLLSATVGLAFSNADLTLGLSAAWLDLRWVTLLGIGLLVARRVPFTTRGRLAVALALGWNIGNALAVVVQIAAGASQQSRLGVPVVDGLFGHPSTSAVAALSLLLLILSDRFSSHRILTDNQLWIGLSLALFNLAASARFKPALALLAALIVIFVWHRLPHRRTQVAAALVVVPIALALALPSLSNVVESQPTQGRNSPLYQAVANAPVRGDLVEGARSLASQRFPVGFGSGTYGSRLDEQEEQNAFDAAGLGDTYGLTADEPAFRSDSQVAHVLAERGYLGLVLWVGGLIAAVAVAVRVGRSHLMPVVSLLALIAIAPVSPGLQLAPYTVLILLPGVLLIDLRPNVRVPDTSSDHVRAS